MRMWQPNKKDGAKPIPLVDKFDFAGFTEMVLFPLSSTFCFPDSAESVLCGSSRRANAKEMVGAHRGEAVLPSSGAQT